MLNKTVHAKSYKKIFLKTVSYLAANTLSAQELGLLDLTGLGTNRIVHPHVVGYLPALRLPDKTRSLKYPYSNAFPTILFCNIQSSQHSKHVWVFT
jgi:hypothetical protein